MTAGFRVATATWSFILALLVAPTVASAGIEPESAQPTVERVLESGTSQDAAFAARWVIDHEDNHQLPFAIVDKKNARLHLFSPSGRIIGESPILLGLAVGDASIAGIASRAPASLAPAERTTPAGRFASEPGHNAQGEDIVWFDYDAALAIHRLRPSPASQRRDERMGSAHTEDRRISAGCVVVPVAFYDAVVRPLLGRQRGVVYVLPETRPVSELFGGGRLSQRAP